MHFFVTFASSWDLYYFILLSTHPPTTISTPFLTFLSQEQDSSPLYPYSQNGRKKLPTLHLSHLSWELSLLEDSQQEFFLAKSEMKSPREKIKKKLIMLSSTLFLYSPLLLSYLSCLKKNYLEPKLKIKNNYFFPKSNQKSLTHIHNKSYLKKIK